jgi:hypothetical protein
MGIFYVYMRERAKKSPFYIAYTQIDEETFACEGKTSQTVLRICVYVTEPKKSQPYRLYGIDPRWSEPANDVHSHCRPRCNNQPRKSSLKNWKLKNLRAFLETSQLLYAAPNAIIDRIAVTHMEWRVG